MLALVLALMPGRFAAAQSFQILRQVATCAGLRYEAMPSLLQAATPVRLHWRVQSFHALSATLWALRLSVNVDRV
jgi:hypothetical protein